MSRLRRRLLPVIAALVVAAAAIAPAVAFNFHHGIIGVTNTTGSEATVTIYAVGDVTTVSARERIEIAPGHTGIFNNCCYAAGSTYAADVSATVDGRYEVKRAYVTPRLCNRNGIPHGYAHASIILRKLPNASPYAALHQDDVACTY